MPASGRQNVATVACVRVITEIAFPGLFLLLSRFFFVPPARKQRLQHLSGLIISGRSRRVLLFACWAALASTTACLMEDHGADELDALDLFGRRRRRPITRSDCSGVAGLLFVHLFATVAFDAVRTVLAGTHARSDAFRIARPLGAVLRWRFSEVHS